MQTHSSYLIAGNKDFLFLSRFLFFRGIMDKAFSFLPLFLIFSYSTYTNSTNYSMDVLRRIKLAVDMMKE